MLELKTVELKKLEDNAACEECQAAHLLRFLKPLKV